MVIHESTTAIIIEIVRHRNPYKGGGCKGQKGQLKWRQNIDSEGHNYCRLKWTKFGTYSAVVYVYMCSNNYYYYDQRFAN